MNRELLIKILLLILLLLLVFITSFRTGTRFYLLKNTIWGNSEGKVESRVAKWSFKAKIIVEDEVIFDEEY